MIYCAKAEGELYALFEKENDAREFAGEDGEVIKDKRFSIQGVRAYLQGDAIIFSNRDALLVTPMTGFYWFPKFNTFPEVAFSPKRGYYRKDLEVKF